MSDKVIQFGSRPPRKPQTPPPEVQPAPRVAVVGAVSGPCHNPKRKATLLHAEGLAGGAVWLALGLPGAEPPWTMLRGDYCAVYGVAEVRVRDEETGEESPPVTVGVEPAGEGGGAR